MFKVQLRGSPCVLGIGGDERIPATTMAVLVNESGDERPAVQVDVNEGVGHSESDGGDLIVDDLDPSAFDHSDRGYNSPVGKYGHESNPSCRARLSPRYD